MALLDFCFDMLFEDLSWFGSRLFVHANQETYQPYTATKATKYGPPSRQRLCGKFVFDDWLLFHDDFTFTTRAAHFL